jgi:HemY protein
VKRLFSLVFKLALIVALAVWLADRPGTARIVWHDYVIETSAAFLGLMVLAVAVAFFALFRIWHFLRNGPAMWRLRRKVNRMQEGHGSLIEGLAAVAGGNATEAGRCAVQARKLLGVTPATQLLQAQAAQLAGDYHAAREIFLTLAADPANAVLGYRGLIMEALRAGDRDEAERLIEKLRRVRPETPWLNLMRFELAARRQAWDEAGRALEHVAATRLMDPARTKRHQAAVLIAAAEDDVRQGQNDKALPAAERAARLAPNWLPAVLGLARQQIGAGHRRAAHRTIERAWARTPHPQLAALYRLAGNGDPIASYREIERLCREHTELAASRLILAEAALEADIWGEARRHLLALAGRNEATKSVYRMLARLERRESGNEQAALQWLTQAIDAPPDPLWLCHNCGGGQDEWHALCRHCGAFDTLDWETPGQSRSTADQPMLLAANWNG